jgi:hypothetical protein
METERNLFSECVRVYHNKYGRIEMYLSGVACVTANNGRRVLVVGDLKYARRVLHDIARRPSANFDNSNTWR